MDESTDITHISQSMVFVRYKVNKSIKEEFLFCELIITITKEWMSLIYEIHFILLTIYNGLKLISVSNNGAPSMLGIRSGLLILIND